MRGSFRCGGRLDLDCDVLVIGSGAGGAAVADALTAAGRDVVMLEEGRYTPPEAAKPRASDAFQECWRAGGLTAALGTPPVLYAEGCCVGGSTEINSAIFQRADSELLDAWAQKYRIADFGARALKPWFDRAADAVHARITPGPLGKPSDVLKEGAERLGWQVGALERAQNRCVATNACASVCPTGAKQSMSASLIPRALKQGLRLIAGCRVERLIVKASGVVGAVSRGTDFTGHTHRVTVRARNVFLCAGAVHTPALLQRSGLRGRIGATLRLHPTVKVIALFDEPLHAADHRLPLYAVTEFMPEQRIGGSVFSPSFFGMAVAEDWLNRAALLRRWQHAGLYYGMIRPQGTGRVTALRFGKEPIIRYAHTPADLRALADCLGRVTQVMFAAGARLVVPSIGGHPGWHDPASALRELSGGLPIRRTNLMSIHLFSSCPPGERQELTVTDSFGRVRGMSNLIVADASQIPEAPGCNPQGTVMAMAYRSAEAFLATPGRKTSSRKLAEAIA